MSRPRYVRNHKTPVREKAIFCQISIIESQLEYRTPSENLKISNNIFVLG